MSKKVYTLIFALLTGSVLCILSVQTYWLFNAYHQKSQDFTRSVYDALEEVGTKLRDRKTLQSLKLDYELKAADTAIEKSFARAELPLLEDSADLLSTGMRPLRVTRVKSQSKVKTGSSQKILVAHNMVVQVSEGNSETIIHNESSEQGKQVTHYVIRSNVPQVPVQADLQKLRSSLNTIEKQNRQLEKTNRDLQKLMDKVVSEIIVLDTETHHPDTVSSLIKRSLENRGVFIPFEFSVQKKEPNKKAEVIVQSKGFNDSTASLKSDLSGSNVIPTREWLYVQFSGKNDHVTAGMQSSILLSLLFSILIISIFYYVMRLILKQKKLSDIKNDFINNMTHELKTPIATISLAVDAMTNPRMKTDALLASDYSRILKEEAQKLNHHVERVLQVALLEKGELPLQLQEVDITALMRETVANYQLLIQEKEAVLTMDFPDHISVKADRRHLAAVFSNLLDNALKYSPSKSKIYLSASLLNGRLLLSFKDEGIGMSEDQQKRVFDKFYRAQGGNLHDVKGFGLGLSYTKSILEQHGARIYVRSVLGKGSEFIVDWPYSQHENTK